MICLILIINPVVVVMSLLSALPSNQRRRMTRAAFIRTPVKS
jgi:hypothetical protein